MDKRRRTVVLKKIDKLLKVLSGKKNIIIISHDNPDPDTMGSAFALRDFISRSMETSVTIAYSGIVGRAQNRAMVKHLGIPLKEVDTLDLSTYDGFITVDSQPHAGLIGLSSLEKLDAIIDHHPLQSDSRKVPFHDIQSRLGATSTIITQYFIVKGMEMDSRIATALLYGIKSDTRDLGRETSKHDLESFLYLYTRANLRLLSKIEYAEVPVEYFQLYDRAIENAMTIDGAVVSFMGDIDNPDMVAEMADTLARLEDTQCALVGGYYSNKIFVSVRTKDGTINAGKLVRRVIGKLGRSGGHGSMSAGRIFLDSLSEREKATLEKTLIRRLKRAMKIKGIRAKKLID